MTKAFTIAAMISAMATASFAGSLNTDVEQEPQDVFVATPSSSGIGLPLAIAGGALLLAAALSDSSSSTTTGDDDGND